MAPTATSIFVHNIYVALFDIGGGLTLGLTTLYGLYLNSMLLGVLSALANQPDVSGTYWSLILPHAVIELTAFTICAGAGLSLAAAVIRAGSASRGSAIRSAGRRAAMIGLGTMPLLVIAGTIEGFVTPVCASDRGQARGRTGDGRPARCVPAPRPASEGRRLAAD